MPSSEETPPPVAGAGSGASGPLWPVWPRKPLLSCRDMLAVVSRWREDDGLPVAGCCTHACRQCMQTAVTHVQRSVCQACGAARRVPQSDVRPHLGLCPDCLPAEAL